MRQHSGSGNVCKAPQCSLAKGESEESQSQRRRGKAGSAQGLSSQSPALSQDKLTLSQRLQELLLLLLFAVLEVAQAPLDKESCSTKVMKTCRELPLARVSKVGARVNSSKRKRRETQCERSRSSVEVSRGRREEGCRGKLEKLNSWKIVLLCLPEHRLQTTQVQDDSSARPPNQLTALIA